MFNDKENSGNYNGYENNLADKLMTTMSKMSEVDTAFKSRFNELMKFQSVLTALEKKIQGLIKTNETKLEKATETLSNSKQDITALDKKITTLQEKSQSHRDYITNNVNSLGQDVTAIKKTQKWLETEFSELKTVLSKHNKVSKIIIWSYRGGLVVMAVVFLYYYSTLNGQITDLNKKFDRLSNRLLENKQSEQQIISDKGFGVDNKSKANKK